MVRRVDYHAACSQFMFLLRVLSGASRETGFEGAPLKLCLGAARSLLNEGGKNAEEVWIWVGFPISAKSVGTGSQRRRGFAPSAGMVRLRVG